MKDVGKEKKMSAVAEIDERGSSSSRAANDVKLTPLWMGRLWLACVRFLHSMLRPDSVETKIEEGKGR